MLKLDAETDASSVPFVLTSVSPQMRFELQESAHVAPSPATPLSISQERLWLWDQLRPGTALLNVARGLTLSGRLDRPRLERSLREIARRHESLRTRIVAEDFTPVQVVSEDVELELTFVDLRSIAETRRKAELNRLTNREAQRPFDVTRAPLVRFCLARIAPEQHVLIVVASRLVWDDESFAVFRRDLCRIDRGLESGKTESWTELSTQYRDFASWHRAWLGESWVAEKLEFWRQTLAGADLDLDLPTDRPRPTLGSYRTGSISIDLDSRLMNQIKALAEREATTRFSVLLAAFTAVLHRYTGHEQIAVGTPVSWRVRPDLEQLIGCFSNTLLVLTTVEPDLSFRELLSRVSRAHRESFDHRHLPYEQVVRSSRQQHERGRLPPLRISFSASDVPEDAAEMGSVELGELELETGAGAADLALVDSRAREQGP